MKLVSYNIQYGKGKDGKVDIDRIIGEIDGADIVALQEIDRHWPRTDFADQLQQLTAAKSEFYWVFGAGVDLHPFRSNLEDKGARSQFGNLILSRYPISSTRHYLLPKYGSVNSVSIQRSVIEATIRCPGKAIRVYSLHLTHLSAQTRLPQIDKLLAIHRDAVMQGHPVSGDLRGMDWEDGVDDQRVPAEAIIMGDFNCPPDTEEYLKMVGPVSDYGGHITNPAGFVDAWTHCGHDKHAGITSDVRGVPARLDYCFVSSSIRNKLSSCHVDELAQGSDHQPLWTEIDLS